MGRRAPILGIVGLVLIVFGLFAEWATHVPHTPWFPPGLFVGGHIVAGIVVLALYFSRGSGSATDFMRARSTRYGLNALVYSGLFIAAVAMANFMAVRYSWRTDLSVAKVNSLSEQSRKVLGGLDKDVRLEIFAKNGHDAVLDELLDAYRYESRRVSGSFIDPQIQPQITSEAGITDLPTVRVWVGKQSTLVSKPDEQAITNGINRLAGSKAQHVYFLDGHGEPDIADEKTTAGMGFFAAALRKQNYKVDKLFLPDVSEMPKDAAVVVVGPNKKEYFPRELDLLQAYLENGGHVLVLMEPREGSDIAAFVEKWGVHPGKDVIVDQQLQLFRGMTLGLDAVVNHYGKHPSVAKMTNRTIFSLARSVTPSAKRPKGTAVVPLAMTSSTSWAEHDLDRLFKNNEAALQSDDLKGPVPIAAIASGPAAKKQTDAKTDSKTIRNFELAVFGDASVASNEYWHRAYDDALALSMVGYLAGEKQLISIGPRAIRASRAYMSPSQATSVFYLSVLLLPELILFVGIAVWWRRSNL